MNNTSKTALVTGATRGIGFETVRQLAQAGVHVLLAGRDRVKAVDAVGGQAVEEPCCRQYHDGFHQLGWLERNYP
jgi:NAD(P)-dependent dehydrogenase (short-subunit alcohol dehydrogenase family)